MRAIDADAFKEYITSACEDMKHLFNDGGAAAKLITESFCKDIDEQPTIRPEIICCKDCVKHNKGIGDIEEQPYGLRKHIMKDESCPLVSWRGKAQGHEFDYQFCVYGKRREVSE